VIKKPEQVRNQSSDIGMKGNRFTSCYRVSSRLVLNFRKKIRKTGKQGLLPVKREEVFYEGPETGHACAGRDTLYKR